jgi:hypothetical protein
MDKFTKNALIACVLLCAFIIASFYVGTALGFNMSGGADDKVNSLATASGGGQAHDSWFYVTQNDEYIGFCSIGIAGGFFCGYLWVMTFEETSNIQGQGTTEVTRHN